jgi:hypothetical protein
MQRSLKVSLCRSATLDRRTGRALSFNVVPLPMHPHLSLLTISQSSIVTTARLEDKDVSSECQSERLARVVPLRKILE